MTFGEVRFLLLDYKQTLVVLIRQGQFSRDASTWLKRNVTPGDLLFTTLEFFSLIILEGHACTHPQ